MLGADAWGRDRTFTVKIETVLAALKKNRDEHIKIVQEAQEAFLPSVIKRLEKMIAIARDGKVDLKVGLKLPVDKTEVFNNAIMALELSLDAKEETIELTADEIERFIRNRWDWMDQFLETNSAYSETAGTMAAEGKSRIG